MSEESFDPEINALEQALARLVPRTTLDRDRVLYGAGQASVRRQGWLWPSVAAGWCGLSLALGTALVVERQQPPREHVVVVEVPAASAPVMKNETPIPRQLAAAVPFAEPLQEGGVDYIQLRRQAVRFGADALPDLPASAPSEPPLSVKRRLDTTPDLFPNLTPAMRRTPS